MATRCTRIASQYEDKINAVVDAQKFENREAIFFIYEDGSTTELFKGEATHISLTREEESRILSQGNVMASVHSHPTGFDPSTIDIMTGIMTNQEAMCVATPVHEIDVPENFVLTCLDLNDLNTMQKRRMLRAMRRGSAGATDAGRMLRKQAALQRFPVEGCRTHTVEIEGVKFPFTERPSVFKFVIGDHVGIESDMDDRDFLGEQSTPTG